MKKTSAVDWSEFHVWCYLAADIKKHSKITPVCKHQVSEHVPCSSYIASRGIISQYVYDCVEMFKHRDAKLVTGRQTETVYAQFLAGASGRLFRFIIFCQSSESCTSGRLVIVLTRHYLIILLFWQILCLLSQTFYQTRDSQSDRVVVRAGVSVTRRGRHCDFILHRVVNK